ncbi:LysR substrate-binding domain-containing protein [Nonomuraea maheshkhaliensis]|uniref:LysR substrate-binding domain-containing protein n=1 Tax=Nonomuraea maheshkhaliensis TaxID=419590 RepID=A0ABN2HKY1_9ACTN
MELRTLEYFVAVAEEESFTRAAARCRVAQPAISQQIRALEHELGEPLFERTSRSVRLSRGGDVLLPFARQALAATAAAVAEFAARSGVLSGSLRIGTVDGVERTDLPAILGEFHRQHANVTVELIGGTSAELLARIGHGALEAAVVALPTMPLPGTLEMLTMLEDEIVAVVPAADDRAKLARLPLTELAGPTTITYARDSGLRTLLEESFAACDGAEAFRPGCETNDVALQVALVKAGIGTALSAQTDPSLHDEKVAIIPLQPSVRYTKAMVWRTQPAPAAPLRALLAIAGHRTV